MLVTQFNNLHGKRVSRKHLEGLLNKAKIAKNVEIIERLQFVLEQNDDAFFKIEIQNKLTEVQKKKAVKKPVKKVVVAPKVVSAKEKKAISPVHKNTPVADLNKNSLAYRKAMALESNKEREYYKIEDKEIAAILGRIERKTKESVAITIGGTKGSGKTTFVYQLINEFCKNYKVGHASLEEHPDSAVYEDRAHKYWSQKAINEVDAPEIKTMRDLHELILENEVIVIDSFGKAKELDKLLKLDNGFRKKYDGKLFIFIFQLTTNDKMRGGSDSEFDADVVLFVKKFDEFSKNYVWNDKNRYAVTDLSDLKFNISKAKIEKPVEVVAEKKPIKKLSFKVEKL